MFLTYLGLQKLIINEQDVSKNMNIPRRNCTKTKKEHEEAIKDTIKGYREIIFGSDTPVCIVCLDELQKQQAIDQHVYNQTLRLIR